MGSCATKTPVDHSYIHLVDNNHQPIGNRCQRETTGISTATQSEYIDSKDNENTISNFTHRVTSNNTTRTSYFIKAQKHSMSASSHGLTI